MLSIKAASCWSTEAQIRRIASSRISKGLCSMLTPSTADCLLPSGWNNCLISWFDIKHEETRYNKRTSILQTVEDHIPQLTSWMFTTGLTTTKRKRGALGISIHHGEWNSVWCRPGRVTSSKWPNIHVVQQIAAIRHLNIQTNLST